MYICVEFISLSLLGRGSNVSQTLKELVVGGASTIPLLKFIYVAVMSEYNDPEADELPPCEEPTVPMTAVEEASKDVHRKYLERQRSQDKESALTSPYYHIYL